MHALYVEREREREREREMCDCQEDCTLHTSADGISRGLRLRLGGTALGQHAQDPEFCPQHHKKKERKKQEDATGMSLWTAGSL
jgi:hypothetical protein